MLRFQRNYFKLAFLSLITLLGWTSLGHCNFTSVTITDLKSPATFYTGKFIQPGDLEFTVVSTSTADGLGTEPGWTQTVNLVSASGACNSASAISNDLSTSTLSDPSGRQVYIPQFYILRPFTGDSVRFQVTIASANATVLGRACSAAINVFDLPNIAATLNKVPAEFYSGKLLGPNDLTLTVNSAGTPAGLEAWMGVKIELVTAAGTTPLTNDLSLTNVNFTTTSITFNPQFRILQSFSGQSVRFQVTISSADNTTLVTRTGTNPTYTSAFNVYDYISSTVTVLRSPTDFFTGKNANANSPGVRVTVNSTDSTTVPVAFGMESWMEAHIAVVSATGSGSISNEVRPNPLALTPGSVNYTPTFYPEAPHTGSSVRYQVTITSAGSNTALTPRNSINAAFSSPVNLYDYVQSSVTIVQGPDPTHAVFTVDQDVNPNPYGVNVVIRSTEPNQNFGPEASHMRLTVELIDSSSQVVVGGLSQEDFTPGTDFSLRSAATNYPNFSPRFASYDQTLRYRITISSANGQLLIPQFGVNPSTSNLVTVNAGTPSKFLLLPENVPLVRPDLVGRTNAYGSSAPFSWNPSALGEGLTVKAYLTDRWSNSVNLPNTELQFAATQYLTLPSYNSGSQWILDSGIQGTDFVFNLTALEILRPITVNSPDGFTSDTIYIIKVGLPEDQIFAGPSPFNPKTDPFIKFGFQMNSDITVKILVLDIFGRKVWETDVQATADVMNTSTHWDGRNGNGDMVAAGVYWVVLEKNGEWISKKKFGVVK